MATPLTLTVVVTEDRWLDARGQPGQQPLILTLTVQHGTWQTQQEETVQGSMQVPVFDVALAHLKIAVLRQWIGAHAPETNWPPSLC